jgi:hypothetical protein
MAMHDQDAEFEDDERDDDRSRQPELPGAGQARAGPADLIDPVGRTPPATRPWWKRILGG